MSQIPRFGSGKPVIKTTSTVTTKTPTGGTKKVISTTIRELLPCSAAGQDASKPGGCQPCPSASKSRSGQFLRPSGIRPPGTYRPPQNLAAPSHPPPMQAPGPARYQAAPPGFPKLVERHRGTFIAPAGPTGLRRPMESSLRHGPRLGDVQHSTRNKRTLQASRGNISEHMRTSRQREDASMMEERGNQQEAEELFNMSRPDVVMVEEQAAHELMERSMLEPDEAVFSKSHHVQPIEEQQMIRTPAGMEPLLQQTYTEKRVERDDVAERVVKNVAVTDMDEATGHGTRITISEQQLDPDYGLPSEGRDVVTVKETVSITPSYTSTAKDVRHEVTKSKIHIDPKELAQMVEEETQDVENTLRMVPPDLPLHEDRYAVKKRLQKLRLNTESMILLEESVVNPAPTADEVIIETPPEALAKIMHTVESGVTPECPPDQIFHTLFEEKSNEQSVILSSIGPGPLQDVVIPQVLTKDIHKESMTPDLTELTNIYKNVTDAKDWPPVDIFASVMDDEAKSLQKDVTAIPFQPLQDEEMPWADEDLEPLVNLVGAEPGVVLDPAYVPDLESSNCLVEELSKGIEYFVNADPVQYMSRVQLRGTQPPPWFPGYIYALPEFPDVVKLARNPDEVFSSSWKSCQPKLIPDESMSILN